MSMKAAGVTLGMLPIDLLANERQSIYERRDGNLLTPAKLRKVSQQ